MRENAQKHYIWEMFAAARLFAYQNKTLKYWHKPQKGYRKSPQVGNQQAVFTENKCSDLN